VRISRGRAGGPSEERGPTFTGRVWADPVLEAKDGVGVNNVFFEPGARTHWHRHEVTQVLHVTSGRGWLQTRAGDGAPLTLGDTAHIPAGEEHWHGACPDSYMSHLAISVGTNEWLDAVSDEDYAAAVAGR
jgi:quercetin dioxygenase-like cupin family protein